MVAHNTRILEMKTDIRAEGLGCRESRRGLGSSLSSCWLPARNRWSLLRWCGPALGSWSRRRVWRGVFVKSYGRGFRCPLH